MDLLKSVWESVTAHHSLSVGLLSTTVLVFVGFVVRTLVSRAIRRNDKLPTDVRRRWLVTLRNATMLLLFLGLMVIWAEELRMAAVSLFAIAVATVIATKELIQCLAGSVLKTASRGFSVGDRIEINGLRGDVIDHNALTTTVLEIGPHELTQQHTGRAIVLPNCMFLDKPVVNETYTDEFVLHVFKVPIPLDKFWQESERELLAAASQECRPYLSDARAHFERLGQEQGITTLSVEPRISVLIPAADELELVVRIAVPARKKGRFEQAILRQYVAAAAERRAAEDQSPEPGCGQPAA